MVKGKGREAELSSNFGKERGESSSLQIGRSRTFSEMPLKGQLTNRCWGLTAVSRLGAQQGPVWDPGWKVGRGSGDLPLGRWSV